MNIPLVSAIAALLAALAAALTNLEKIVGVFAKFRSWLSSKRNDEPVLLSISIRTTDRRQNSVGRTIAEQGLSRFDVMISYEGSDKLIFDRIDVVHQPSLLTSIGTGALPSSATYNVQFKYGSVVTERLSPPVVINPESGPLLRFEVEFTPEGAFPTTGGSVYARVGYIDTKGRAGVLPLFALNPDDYRDYPELYERIIQRHEFLFPVFGGRESWDKNETYKLTKNYLIKGKPVKELVPNDCAVHR